jgi:hypothetical protein
MHWTFGFLGISWSLKRWWDAGGFWPGFLGHWPDYRHYAFRDQFEPAVATILVLSVLAPARYWGRRVGLANLIARLLAVLVGGILLGVLGVYLRDFGLPYVWAHTASKTGHTGYNLNGSFSWAGKLSLFTLAWGALMGFVLHTLWGPAGSTIQGYWVDRLADRGRERQRVAWYIRGPFAPPLIRERYSELYLDPSIEIAKPGKANRGLLSTITFAVALAIVLGLTAKYWIAHGHTIPYIAPGVH